MPEEVWRPTPEWVEKARITQFVRRCGLPDLEAVQKRAEQDPAWFWSKVVEDLGIEWYRPPQQVLDVSRGVPWARWFRGALMNLAHDAVDKHIGTPKQHKAAIIYEGEEGQVRVWTYRDLWVESNRLAHALQSLGVTRGDRVGLFLPMLPETAAAIFAVAKLGAIFVPIFSGFAPQAVASRLADARAKLLITADGFYRRGSAVAMKETADKALEMAPTVEKMVVVRRLGAEVPWTPGRDYWYHDVAAARPRRFPTEPLDPEEPVMIIYTSGTTGRPKGAVHVHGGFPIKAAQDMAHCFDLAEQDLMFWFTDIGWMMGPWLMIGTLMNGATMFLYDGAPDFPAPDRIWAMVERHGISHLGLSPTVIRALAPAGDAWPAGRDLSSLRVLGSTGEPWNPEPYRWYFQHVGGGRCPIINYSGGTEIAGGILGCVPIRPIRVCSFNAVCPGMGAALLDGEGQPVAPGEVGELCLKTPWPGMTRGFWQDPARYLENYWHRWDGIWVHGDWASQDEEGFWYIHGRSDDTIKVAGKRVGPAEYESALVGHPAVAEAAAVGVPHPVKGEAVVCFAVLREGASPGPELAAELKERAAHELGRALAPLAVEFVSDLPRTRSGKVMRRVIRAAYLGLEPGDLSALENPQSLPQFGEIGRRSSQKLF